MSDQEHLQLGWLCPRCGHVWAPDVRECTCEPEPVLIVPQAWYETATLDMSGVEMR
jgi:hypothetical protein